MRNVPLSEDYHGKMLPSQAMVPPLDDRKVHSPYAPFWRQLTDPKVEGAGVKGLVAWERNPNLVSIIESGPPLPSTALPRGQHTCVQHSYR